MHIAGFEWIKNETQQALCLPRLADTVMNEFSLAAIVGLGLRPDTKRITNLPYDKINIYVQVGKK